MHNWYIGQDVVCIKTHSEGVVKEGETYTIKSLKEGFCNCISVLIHIGIFDDSTHEMCQDCDIIVPSTGNILWLWEGLLGSPDTLTCSSEMEEILNQPIEELFKVK